MVSRLGCTCGSLPRGFWGHLCQLSQARGAGVPGGSRHCRPAPRPPSPASAPSTQLCSPEPQLDQVPSLCLQLCLQGSLLTAVRGSHCLPISRCFSTEAPETSPSVRFQGTVQRAALLPRDEGWWPQRGPQRQHLSALPTAHSGLHALPPGSRKPKGLRFSLERCRLSSLTAFSSQMPLRADGTPRCPS